MLFLFNKNVLNGILTTGFFSNGFEQLQKIVRFVQKSVIKRALREVSKIIKGLNKMNKIILNVLLLSLSLGFSGIRQKSENSDAIKTAVKLFRFVTIKDYRSAATLIAYKGSNIKRNLKTSFNYNIKSEKKKVDLICKRIYKYFKISDSFKILRNKTKNLKNSGKEIFVQFNSGRQKLVIGFKFLKSGNKYLLEDID